MQLWPVEHFFNHKLEGTCYYYYLVVKKVFNWSEVTSYKIHILGMYLSKAKISTNKNLLSKLSMQYFGPGKLFSMYHKKKVSFLFFSLFFPFFRAYIFRAWNLETRTPSLGLIYYAWKIGALDGQ